MVTEKLPVKNQVTSKNILNKRHTFKLNTAVRRYEFYLPVVKTNLLAENDHVIDIFTIEDRENISLCIFSIFSKRGSTPSSNKRQRRKKNNIKRPLEWTRSFSKPVTPQPEIKLKSCQLSIVHTIKSSYG